jgi:hypothetical protein
LPELDYDANSRILLYFVYFLFVYVYSAVIFFATRRGWKDFENVSPIAESLNYSYRKERVIENRKIHAV